MNAMTDANGLARYCEDGLRLRHKVQKLRWMGLEGEADQLVREIGGLGCHLPQAIAMGESATD